MLAATILLTLLGLFFLFWFLWGVALAIGLQTVNVEWKSLQVFKTVSLCALLSVLLNVGVSSLSNEKNETMISWVGICMEFFFTSIAIMIILKTNYWRAVVAFIPTSFVSLAFMLLVAFWVTPHFCSSFTSASNLMAPTILGPHVKARCEHCRNVCFGNPAQVHKTATTLICTENFHLTEAICKNEVSAADRYLVSLVAKPQRWDIIAYQTSSNDSQMTLGRVVGLPGETITIKDGRVCADSKAIEQPESIKNLNYGSGPGLQTWEWNSDGLPVWKDTPNEDYWGSEMNPARLGAGEFFVLADNSDFSVDSRNLIVFGSSSNAIRETEIIGVVSCIYWPIRRWAIFR